MRNITTVNNVSKNNQAYSLRLRSIDLLRGLALILMALDHVRDYFGPTLHSATDLSHTTTTLFFTRFITHFCAPIFVFLTGVSAYLYGLKHTRSELSKFLFIRGIWLIFLEITIVTFGWKFNFDKTLVLQVIFVLGFSMVLLSAFIWLPKSMLLVISLIIIFGHNIFDSFTVSNLFLKYVWYFLHVPTNINWGSWTISIIYPIVPWFAIMLLGYYLGSWFNLPIKLKTKYFLYLGTFCMSTFCILRFFNIYGDSQLNVIQENNYTYSILSTLNVTKYPPSLLYILLTLGVTFILLPLLEKWESKSSRFVLCFGKVSLFFYLIHIYLIHILAIFYSRIILNSPGGWWWGNVAWIKTRQQWPDSYHQNLLVVYGSWIILIMLMYPLCYIYQNYKCTHNYKWLSYL